MSSGIWNVGSVAEHVGAIVGWSNIPIGISGPVFNNMIEQEINFVELYATETVSSDSIGEKYQPSVIDLTLSKILKAIDIQEGDVDKVKLGDLSVSQSSGKGNSSADALKESAILRLKELQRKIRFKRVLS